MPTYDYRCTKCGRTFELFHSIKDETPKRCPRCRGRAKRVPSGGVGLLFKGSGFYITDYRSKGYKESAKQEGGGSSDKPAGTSPPAPSGGASEAKPGKPEAGGSAKPETGGSAKPEKS